MNICIIGPMTGLPDFNYPLFHAAAELLRGQGHSVFNPAESFGGDTTRDHAEYMRASLGALLGAEGVVLLPGWETSAGAKTELRVALALKLQVLHMGGRERPIPDSPDD